MTRLELRPYQQRCLDAHFRYFETHETGNPLFVVPTGAGKSLIIAEFVRRCRVTWPHTRFIVPTHVKELVQQNYLEFIRQWGDDDHDAGIYSAGLKRRDLDASVIFANIQSIYRRVEEIGPFDLVLIDEAHLVPPGGHGRYRTYLANLRRLNPKVRALGYTATHYRLDQGLLHKGKNPIFTDVAFEVSLDELIPEYLCSVHGRAVQSSGEIDTQGVSISAGEYNLAELERAATQTGCIETSVREIVCVSRDQGRKSWLIFCTTIRHAELVLKELEGHAVNAVMVTGDTNADERRDIVESFRSGKVTAIVNVGVLTTGFNAPRCDVIAILRPTRSTCLYVQMCGRGMRKFEGKKDCLLLDYGGNIRRHGPINDVDVTIEKGGGETPTKVCKVETCKTINKVSAASCIKCEMPFLTSCPKCSVQLALRTKTCPHCGHEFFREHDGYASSETVLAKSRRQPAWIRVDRWSFRRHTKQDKPPSVLVTYYCGLRAFREWLCPEHGGGITKRANRWWRQLGGSYPYPSTTESFIERAETELCKPHEVRVEKNGKYENVVDYSMRERIR